MSLPLFKKTQKKPGSSPGTITYTGEKKMEAVRIRIIRYDVSTCDEKEFDTIEAALEYYKSSPGMKWLNIDGLHDTALLKKIGDVFDIHVLALEDIVNIQQRPKFEVYEHQLFISLKMFYAGSQDAGIASEQMSFVVGKDYVLSFQERVGDVFEEVRNRLRTGGSGLIRKHGSDYLLYALTDAVVDHYFIVLEKLGNALEDIDERLGQGAQPEILRDIHSLKREVIALKKMTWPLRELFGGIIRTESKMIAKKNYIFFRDVQDHVVQVLDAIEGFREMTTTMFELYQSSVGNKMNEVMKVLTIIATIFIPPTFLAGIYGMNFQNMPELSFTNGYFVVLGVMLVSIVGMLFYFKRKRWF